MSTLDTKLREEDYNAANESKEGLLRYIAARVHNAREIYGIQQDGFRLSTTSMSNIESGTHDTRVENLRDICERLGISLFYLLSPFPLLPESVIKDMGLPALFTTNQIDVDQYVKSRLLELNRNNGLNPRASKRTINELNRQNKQHFVSTVYNLVRGTSTKPETLSTNEPYDNNALAEVINRSLVYYRKNHSPQVASFIRSLVDYLDPNGPPVPLMPATLKDIIDSLTAKASGNLRTQKRYESPTGTGLALRFKECVLDGDTFPTYEKVERDFEKVYFGELLRRNRWSKRAVARAIGWSGEGVNKKVRQLGLEEGAQIESEFFDINGASLVDSQIPLQLKGEQDGQCLKRYVEELYFKAVMNRAGGNIAEAARVAGWTRFGVHKKLKELKIDADTYRGIS